METWRIELLRKAGLPTALDLLFAQAVRFEPAHDGDPYRTMQPPRLLVTGRVAGLVFTESRSGLYLPLETEPERGLAYLNFDGKAWSWFEGRWWPGAFMLESDYQMNLLLAEACPDRRDALKRFCTSGDSGALLIEHIIHCRACQAARDKVFEIIPYKIQDAVRSFFVR